MSEPKTINATINLFQTIKECGSENPPNNFVISLIFRSLLLVDAFHDFSDVGRINGETDKVDKVDKVEKVDKTQLQNIYKALLDSYKDDILYIIGTCGNQVLKHKLEFFRDLFTNFIGEILVKINDKKDNPTNPHFVTIDVNKLNLQESDFNINNMSVAENIKERIFCHSTIYDISSTDYDTYYTNWSEVGL